MMNRGRTSTHEPPESELLEVPLLLLYSDYNKDANNVVSKMSTALLTCLHLFLKSPVDLGNRLISVTETWILVKEVKEVSQ